MEDISDIISKFLPIWVQTTIAILAVAGGLWALWDKTLGRLFTMFNLFPSMERWTAICLPWQEGDPNPNGALLDPDRPLRSPGARWCQMRNMRIGDYYQVDMQKDRVISRLYLRCDEGRYPKKYRIQIEKDGDSTFEDLGEHSGPIDYRLPKPRKFRIVKFAIIEPDILPNNAPHSWCVYEIRFWEVRLLRWPTWRIKAK